MEWSAQFDGFRDRFRDGFADVRSEENVDLVPILQNVLCFTQLMHASGGKSGSTYYVVFLGILISSYQGYLHLLLVEVDHQEFCGIRRRRPVSTQLSNKSGYFLS